MSIRVNGDKLYKYGELVAQWDYEYASNGQKYRYLVLDVLRHDWDRATSLAITKFSGFNKRERTRLLNNGCMIVSDLN